MSQDPVQQVASAFVAAERQHAANLQYRNYYAERLRRNADVVTLRATTAASSNAEPNAAEPSKR